MVDNRPRASSDNSRLGHNGYVLLSIKGIELTISYFDEKEKLLTETWTTMPGKDTIKGRLQVFSKELKQASGKSWQDAVN